MPGADWWAARLASEWSGRLVREDSAEDLNAIRAGTMTGRAERWRTSDNRKHPPPGIETEKARMKAQEGEMRYVSPSSASSPQRRPAIAHGVCHITPRIAWQSERNSSGTKLVTQATMASGSSAGNCLLASVL